MGRENAIETDAHETAVATPTDKNAEGAVLEAGQENDAEKTKDKEPKNDGEFTAEMKKIEKTYEKIIGKANARKEQIEHLDKKMGEYEGVIQREMFNIPFDNSGPEKVRLQEATKEKGKLETENAAAYGEVREKVQEAMERTGAGDLKKSEATAEQWDYAQKDMKENIARDPEGHAKRMEAGQREYGAKTKNKAEYDAYEERLKTMSPIKRIGSQAMRFGRFVITGKSMWEGEGGSKEK